ncbi:TOX4 [Fusarium beomiforme]|uniref:TOX4 n=1 Tax=Fusarium beomiforme TaxID=44412 RepID=A0A9P5ABX0_9HYPO|nr:TOX4 [Fusarium beomiforme]
MFKYALLALAATFGHSEALGINCKGSGLCVGNKGDISNLAAQVRALDPSKTFSDGEHIACVDINNLGNPSLCLFYQKVGDRKFSVSETQTFLQQIIDHGCGLCGSTPIDGRDVNNGELTANAVTNANRRKRTPSGFTTMAKRGPSSLTQRSSILAKREGINCHGSSTCGVGGIGHTPDASLKDVRDAVAAGEEGNFANGDHVACVPFATGNLCAFYQNIGSRTFTKEQSVALLDTLVDHGCQHCGSIPTDPGNNVANGELTVNFVA